MDSNSVHSKWWRTPLVGLLIVIAAVCVVVFQRSAGSVDRKQINWQYLDAARSGNEVGVKEALRRGADPSALDENGNSALILAARKGTPGLAQTLIQSHVPLDHTNHSGVSALEVAAKNKNEVFMMELVMKGAKPPIMADANLPVQVPSNAAKLKISTGK